MDWDNRREIYDRFLTSAQTLLIDCEKARESKTKKAKASVETAHTKFFEVYGVVLTVAERAAVDAARVYAYRLWELKESLDSMGVMGPENFETVASLVRTARHDLIDAMRAELGLPGSARLEGKYNPFVGTALEREYAEGKRPRPGAAIDTIAPAGQSEPRRVAGRRTLVCILSLFDQCARRRVARRAPGGPNEAEPGADAGPAAP